jgi:hypothetical protein
MASRGFFPSALQHVAIPDRLGLAARSRARTLDAIKAPAACGSPVLGDTADLPEGRCESLEPKPQPAGARAVHLAIAG